MFELKDFSVLYGDFEAVRKVSLNMEANKITAMIGPSGCGKTTLLRCLNRMNDLIVTCRTEGQALFH
ncbi:MAG TPA: ATP-binding cassette domain-containing protein, partial [Thermodesulfobacteriota bacterium]|nr:ATP-binding cassette domain-containing protein [Thermodesulfobacteriota bacterium]